ncbi:uncharacterized protein LOC129222089 [Uloborus diversus]|uniref:uncharacterized protein LOC129222089 n=1 Tax=Uloborus diversus TaxID=327109 RepID=UPI002409F58F|nr:uncharacterized protein LOC129222089 [Uloborus diversus]XP_054712497.1 uncharacterized protein LOC129222089 [Uloborus diversus]XP_054712498.1 uncharacterized protein LOC129222089 [Uloborus diversus]
MAHSLIVCTVDVHQLAAIVRNRIDNALILDSRSFLEYNACHVVNAINVGCAKLMKRRLQQEKLSIEDFLAQSCHWDVDRSFDIIVYDQNTCDAKCLPPDSFMAVFLQKLLPVYNSVNILKGGFLEFQAAYPNLCEDERSKFAPLTSLSQPCLPVTNHGPTRILPFLYLGSQHDALNKEVLQHHNITYHLNVSTSCPKPDFIQDSHFLRIPVIDNYSEKLLPHFPKAFQFLDKVKESGGSVLIHCLAGISRSATVAIAYVMRSLSMNSDEAYRYVKAKRATISPNFNFLGQLLEYEKQLCKDYMLGKDNMFGAKPGSSVPVFNCPSPSFKQKPNANNSKSTRKECAYSIKNSSQEKYVENYSDISSNMVSHSILSTNTKECYMAFEQTDYRNQNTSSCIPNKQCAALNIKCLPVSCLKELNFTPCQAPAVKTSPHSAYDKSFLRGFAKCESQETLTRSECFSPTLSDVKLVKKNHMYSDVMLTELKLDALRSLKCVTDLHSPPDLKTFDFDSKPYNRSDSVSTSGLGSEGSDCADSWNDYTSSCERETDILMDEDYLIVPTDEDELHSNKRLGFDDSYEDSLTLYPKYEHYYDCRPKKKFTEDYSRAVPNEDAKNERLKRGNGKCTSSRSCTEYPHNTEKENAGAAHILYRAQSCPGMLSSEAGSACSYHVENFMGSSNIKLRKAKNEKSSIDKCRNRYSCSSIDYMDYSHNAGSSQEPSLTTQSDAATMTSSHCNYRHSMIQVS